MAQERGGGPIGREEARPAGGAQIEVEEARPSGGVPIESESALAVATAPLSTIALGQGEIAPTGGAPISERSPSADGISIEAPSSYIAGEPIGGPSSVFNIGGAPIAVLGGVFTNGLPIGGPVGQIFRSGAPEPNILYISTLEPSGPIGQFLLGIAGAPLGTLLFGPLPIGSEFLESGAPIGFGRGEGIVG